MAILFDDAANESLLVNSVPVSALPISMACFFNVDDITANHYLMSLVDKDASDAYLALNAGGNDAGDPVRLTSRFTTVYNASTTTGFSANTTHHALGVATNATARAAFIDGGSKGTSANSSTPANLDRIAIGGLVHSAPTGYTSGWIAEAAIWNVALSDAEGLLLARGFSPLFFITGLVAYWPLIRLNAAGIQRNVIRNPAYDLTETNTPASAVHPPKIIYPSWVAQ